jgi:acetylornithine deacetylase/succinyl-diaminopimelate desuccinylase-like protein
MIHTGFFSKLLGRDRITFERRGAVAGTDDNHTAFVGTATIDSTGFVDGQGHTADEYMNIASIPPRLCLLTQMLMELGSQKWILGT